MKKVNLTDQELNEWVLNKLFEGPVLKPLDFCNNLNHTRLMWEKIEEMGKGGEYIRNLMPIVNLEKGMGVEILPLVNASARQRCEACFLTFNKTND